MDKLESLIYYVRKKLFVVIKLLSVTLADTVSYWFYLVNDNHDDTPIDRTVLNNDGGQRHYRLRRPSK